MAADANDLYLHDLDHQNEATWRVLDSAIAHRDLATRMHGTAVVAAVVFLPFIGSAYSVIALLAVAAGVLLFLAAATYVILVSVEALRLQQIHLSYAGAHAALLLEDPGRRRFFSLPRNQAGAVVIRVVPLGRQADPMGLSVRSALAMFAFDGSLVAIIGLWAASTGAVELGPGNGVVLAGSLLAAAVTFSLAVRFWRSASREEARLARELAGKFESLGIPAVVG